MIARKQLMESRSSFPSDWSDERFDTDVAQEWSWVSFRDACKAVRKAFRDNKELREDGTIPNATFPEQCKHDNIPVFPAEAKGVIKRWLLDTGAGIHVVGRQYLTKQQLAGLVQSDPVTLATATGTIEVTQTVELWVDELGFIAKCC